MEALDVLAWPVGRLGEAMAGLAQLRGWQLRRPEAPVCPAELAYDHPEALHGWLEAAATWLGVEAELVEVPYAEVASLVYGAGPALLFLPGQDKLSVLALLGRQRRRVLLLGPDLAVHRVPVEVLCQACCHAVEAPLEAEVEPVLDAIGVSGWHRHRARRALLGERLSGLGLGGCWVLRLPAAASFWQQLRQAHLPYYLGGLLGAYAAQYLCGILAWWLLGWGACAAPWSWGATPRPHARRGVAARRRDRLAALAWRAQPPLHCPRAVAGCPILILDERFAALDPETLHRVHQCVLDHAPTLMVIAHP